MNKKYFWSLLTFLMVSMLSVGFASCGDDDDDGDGNFSIVGKWTMYESAHNGDSEGELVAEIVFNADNTGTYEEYNSSGVLRGKIEPLTYNLNGNALSFNINGDTGTWYITIVSSKEFRTGMDNDGLIFKKQ